MISNICQRSWLSPLVCIFFVAVGVSGTLMLFHAELGAMRVMHEWIGLGFVIAATLHFVLNWRPFLTHCKTRGAVVALTLGAVLCAGFLFAGAHHDRDGHGQGHGQRHGDARHH